MEFGGKVSSQNTAHSSRRRIPQERHSVGVRLVPKHALGVTGPRHDGVQCIGHLPSERGTGDKLVYVTGCLVVVYHMDEAKMQFLQPPRSAAVRAINALRVSNHARVVAVCEVVRDGGDDRPCVSVYSLSTFGRLKSMSHATKGEFLCCCWSDDDKTLVTLFAGAIERAVQCWQWEREKLQKNFAVNNGVMRVSAIGTSNVQISTSGVTNLRLWSLGSDNLYRATPLLQAAKEQDGFVGHIWLALAKEGLPRKMAALSETLTVEGGRRAIVYIFEGHDASTMELRQSIAVRAPTNARLETIALYGKGFMVAGGGGLVSIYERSEEKRELYIEIRSVVLADELIISVAVLPADERVVCYSKSGRLLTFTAASLDGQSTDNCDPKDFFAGGFHTGAVISMDASTQRPLVLTLGEDKMLRAWNLFQSRTEVLQNFPNDEPACLSCHPLGFQVVVGFKEHIRIYNIVMDELKLFRETPVKGCRDIRFSHGGHMFAATASINVLVFCSVTFEQLFSFQGHMGPVRRVVWTHKDSMLLSIAADGNVYGWNSRTGGRVDLLTSSGRGTTLQGLAVDHKDSNALHDQLRSYSQSETSSQLTRDEMSCAVISSSDGTVRLLHWQADESSADGQEEVELELPPKVSITTLHLSLSTTLLYTGQSDGNIRVYSWPLTSNAPYVEYSAHTGSVTCLAETIDGKALLSCGEDGSVFIFAIFIEQVGVSAGVSLSFNLQTSLSIADIMLAENYNADVMFVSREEIEEHVNETIELNKQITSMKSKHEFDLHQRDSELADEVRKLTEQRDAQLNIEKDKLDQLQHEMDARTHDLLAQHDTKETMHTRLMNELENQYEHRLADQLERYDRLSEGMEQLKQQCEGLLEAQKNEIEEQLQALNTETRQREKKLKYELKKLREDRSLDENTFKEVLDQQEAEYEDELRQLIAAAETELNSERGTLTKMRTLIQTKNTNLDQMRKKMSEMKVASQSRQALLFHEREEKKRLQETIEYQQKNLIEREEALAEKEKVILDLRNTTKTLENFRFVLDHRLQQLTAERGPITKHIEGLESHIKSMYEEMVTEFERKKSLDREVENRDMKIVTMSSELARLRQQCRERELCIASFRRELSTFVSITVPKDLEGAVKDAYKRFVREEPTRLRKHGSKEGGVLSKFLAQAETLSDQSDDNSSAAKPSCDQHKQEEGIPTEAQAELLAGLREAFRQRNSVEKQANTLRVRLDHAKRDAKRLSKTRLAENSQLIYECNNLRRQLRIVQRQYDSVHERLRESLKAAARFKEEAFTEKIDQSSINEEENVPMKGNLHIEAPKVSLASSTSAPQFTNLTTTNCGRRTVDAHAHTSHVRVGAQTALTSITSLKSEVEFLQAKLDNNERERQMQKMEIQRLRETMRLLQSQLDTNNASKLTNGIGPRGVCGVHVPTPKAGSTDNALGGEGSRTEDDTFSHSQSFDASFKEFARDLSESPLAPRRRIASQRHAH